MNHTMTNADILIKDIDMNGVIYEVQYTQEFNSIWIYDVTTVANPFEGTEDDLTYAEGELWGYLTEHLENDYNDSLL